MLREIFGSSKEKFILGTNGMIFISPKPEAYSNVLSFYSFIRSLQLYQSVFFARIRKIWDLIKDLRKEILDIKREESIGILEQELSELSADIVLIEEVIDFMLSGSNDMKKIWESHQKELDSSNKLLAENLDISREQLIEMGILIGVDFYPGIKGIGQHTALDLIRKYGSLEKIIMNKVTVGKKEINIEPELIHEIKEIFLNPDVNKEYPKLVWNKINYEKIEELLIENHNFSKQRVEGALERLKKIDSSKVQTSLDSFFKKK